MSTTHDTRLELRTPALIVAIVLGVLADQIVRTSGRPGIGVGLWASVGVVVMTVLLRRGAVAPSGETWWCVGGALAFAWTLVLRDAEALAVFGLLAAVVCLTMAAGRATTAWAARAQVADAVYSILRVGVLSAAGPIGWGRGATNASSDSRGWQRVARIALRGIVMALPPLVLLAALLMNADPVFNRIVLDALHIDIEPLITHVAFACAIAWVTAGYARAFLIRDDVMRDAPRVPQPALGAAELSVALCILNALFLTFMAVQLRYLFGGADLVEVTPGLTYAQYARRGFFELIACTALVVPILLAADWAAAPQASRARDILRASMLLLVVLLIGVIASAAFRMKLYQGAYGLTEERLYVSVITVWLAVVLAWLAFTVLRGRRERFLIGTVVAGLACIATLCGLNPHALIARVNTERAINGAEYDVQYLRSLSADAVPTLLERMPALPEAERCRVAAMLKERWSGARTGDWRSWNVSDWRARRLVAPVVGSLACAPASPAPKL